MLKIFVFTDTDKKARVHRIGLEEIKSKIYLIISDVIFSGETRIKSSFFASVGFFPNLIVLADSF